MCFLSLFLLSFSPSPQAKAIPKKKGFLSLMANSHKFVLNMSSIDWPCQMNTIKETPLSASHLGGEDGGIKRRRDRGNIGGKWRERIDGQGFWQLLPSSRSLSTCCCKCVCVAVCTSVIHLLPPAPLLLLSPPSSGGRGDEDGDKHGARGRQERD